MTGQDIYMLAKAANELVDLKEKYSDSGHHISIEATIAVENILNIIEKYKPGK